jgi:predicted dehydrogenase
MLSIGYRLHFDPYHLEVAKIGTQKVYGNVIKISSTFSQITKKGEWRLDRKFSGGGALMDLGIYCLQAVCYATGMEPVAITAQSLPISDEEKFMNIEETVLFQMEMPDGLLAECKTSYSEAMNYLRIEAENGFIELQPAFNYDGLQGKTAEYILQYPPISQQAKQMDAFALAIKNNELSTVPGEMGKRDMRIITAIYESIRTGKRVVT